jgi:uncharacterized membrane protein
LPPGGEGPGEGSVVRPRSLMVRLRTYLFAGIVVTAPVSITFLIVWQILEFLDRTVSRLIPARYDPATYLPFGIPGIGRYFVQGALGRDYTLVMGTVVVIAVFVIVFNLIVDLAYAWLDPRVRYD